MYTWQKRGLLRRRLCCLIPGVASLPASVITRLPRWLTASQLDLITYFLPSSFNICQQYAALHNALYILIDFSSTQPACLSQATLLVWVILHFFTPIKAWRSDGSQGISHLCVIFPQMSLQRSRQRRASGGGAPASIDFIQSINDEARTGQGNRRTRPGFISHIADQFTGILNKR